MGCATLCEKVCATLADNAGITTHVQMRHPHTPLLSPLRSTSLHNSTRVLSTITRRLLHRIHRCVPRYPHYPHPLLLSLLVLYISL